MGTAEGVWERKQALRRELQGKRSLGRPDSAGARGEGRQDRRDCRGHRLWEAGRGGTAVNQDIDRGGIRLGASRQAAVAYLGSQGGKEGLGKGGDLAGSPRALELWLHFCPLQREGRGGAVCPGGLGAQQVLVILFIIVAFQVRLLIL